VPQFPVLVASAVSDLQVSGIIAAIRQRRDMTLISERMAALAQVRTLLRHLPASQPCALILVESSSVPEDSGWPAEQARLLNERPNLVVLRLDIVRPSLQIELRDLGLDPLLGALRALLDHAGAAPSERITRIRVTAGRMNLESSAADPSESLHHTPLLRKATEWVHAVLRSAIDDVTQRGGRGDLPGLTLTAATMSALLSDGPPGNTRSDDAEIRHCESALSESLEQLHESDEPLAVLVRRTHLTRLECRLLLLALAPELDARYPRCIGLLLDDLGRRHGTFGLFAGLLGDPAEVRWQVSRSRNLLRWRLIESRAGGMPAADEAMRIDPPLAEWLLGDPLALEQDVRLRRVTRPTPWPGASLSEQSAELTQALHVIHELRKAVTDERRWILLTGDPASAWCAPLEQACLERATIPIRADAARVLPLEALELEETAIRLSRLASIAARPLVLDTTSLDASPAADEMLRTLFGVWESSPRPVGVLCADAARMVRLLGPAPTVTYDLRSDTAGRGAAVQKAAERIAVPMSTDAAEALAQLYPLQADGFEHAMRLAHARGSATDNDERRLQRFVSACQDVAAEGASRLSDRINPVFKLSDVVLPAERLRQLHEIVDSVRLAKRVLDDWRFREQLPYGRAVTALFHGPSGCGKTMGALAVARELNVQVLRIDLSRIVSKYYGDTEKNIDRIFLDARNCGAAILIDEADALLGRRGEIRDAQDRHANVEVAYLLQRIESYEEGLAIFTTNLRQNIDAAFLRRLRFVIDFPRPDAAAREEIWRRCLPADSHALDDADFRQLARKIDLTGGNIRQITLRAAFVAAAANSRIRLQHVAHASRAEMAKLGLPPAQLDLPREEAA
jgi:hypothetical protein